MKLFGEFLIDEGLVERSDLLAALVRQLQRMPSHAEIVYELKLLPEETLLEAFKLQTVRKISFVEACQELKAWNQALSDAIHEDARKRRVPLGQLLLEMKVIDADALTRALDDYLGGVAAAPAAKAPAGQAEGGAGAALVKAFSASRLKDLPVPVLQTAMDDLHRRRGHARLKSLDALEKLIAEAEPVLAKMKEKAGKEMPDELFQKAMRLLPPAFSLVEELSNEGQGVDSPDRKKAYEQCLNELPVLCFDMDFL